MAEKDFCYTYSKIRHSFGKQPLFCSVPAHTVFSILPDETEQKEYCLRNPVNREVQASPLLKEQYVNSKTVAYKEHGMNHVEGGWPKDIPSTDEELTTKYRRRCERNDDYVKTVLGSQKNIEHFLKQNNAIEMYEMFFKNMPSTQPIEKTSLIVNNIYKDKNNRKIASLSWTFEDGPKLVVAYCDKTFPIAEPVNKNLVCYVWDLHSPRIPVFEFLPPTACWQATCSPGNPSLIIGGLESGRVCVFDIRNQEKPVMISPEHLAHRDPVTALVYMQSRLNIEFFSGSSDGSCLWWDVRNLSSPIDNLIMSIKVPQGEQISLANAEGITALRHDKAFPTRFLCGTETGLVVDINRKGKTRKEVIKAVYNAHLGPVWAVQRSPCTSKIFISCGDWTVHVWSDEIGTSPIITGIQQRYSINDVSWAPKRISSYMTVSADGVFRYWDLLRKHREPVKSFRLSKSPLLKIKPQQDGELIAIGDASGVIYILSLSESLVISGENDKSLMLQLFERETRREKLLETRVKEIFQKQTTDTTAVGPADSEAIEDPVLKAEAEYRRIVSEENAGIGVPTKLGSMRKR